MEVDRDAEVSAPQHRVRVWFGCHAICTFVADPDNVEEYAALVARRFRGLRITVDEPPAGELDPAAPLPHKLLWETTPRLFA